MKNLLFIIVFVFLGCTSLSLKQFNRVETGMSKSAVLEKLGSPFKSEYRDEITYWMYRFYEDRRWIEKEVQFQNGEVIYVGDVMNILERERFHYRSPIEKQQELEKTLKNTNHKSPQNKDHLFKDVNDL